ncbi:MAG: hypothetical protein K2K09_00945 [Lachnospiraceae bacterium]|nr:hypothetical protein [Lachnospiraceae bacterium]
MSDIQVSIKPTDIKKIDYQAPSVVVPGQSLSLEVKTNTKAVLNMSAPLTALVEIEFAVTAKEDEKFGLTVQTVTGLTVSSFVDNLDDVILKNYAPSILLAANEKFKQIHSLAGITLRLPHLVFPFNR